MIFRCQLTLTVEASGFAARCDALRIGEDSASHVPNHGRRVRMEFNAVDLAAHDGTDVLEAVRGFLFRTPSSPHLDRRIAVPALDRPEFHLGAPRLDREAVLVGRII
ncbi:hypothetical protein ACFYXF_47150 [Streptomyces sp. NPDC002680]|uniref:hypothetical protein n=1 Tax=Streptomyces sp. NPDC002680 TaxID=3364659 RepID=UPI00367C2E1C